MPTPVAHAIAGAAIAVATSRERWPDPRLFAGSIAAACFADVDFGIGFLLGRNVHHYFTHSIGFSLLFAGAIYGLGRIARWPGSGRLSWILGASYFSHVLLDMLSKDTRAPFGVELFWPVSDRFVISPLLVFDDIWRGTLRKLFGLHNWLAVAREILILGPVAALVVLWKRRALQRE